MTTDEEKLWELWLHWARMPAWSHHEASALIAGIIPSKWDYDGLARKHYTFGEERNTRYFRTWSLLLREQNVYGIRFPAKLDALCEWAQRTQIQFSDKFEAALIALNKLPLSSTVQEEPSAIAEEQSTDKLGTRERDTLLSIIAAASVAKYGYTPRKRNNAAAQILNNINDIGLQPISAETIRNKLKAASELIPQSYFSTDSKKR